MLMVNSIKENKMDYKKGDKFICEISEIGYYPYFYYEINGIKGLKLDKTDLDKLQPYKEPTIQDHLKAFKEYTKMLENNVVGENKIVGNNKKVKLTKEELKIVNYWKSCGAIIVKYNSFKELEFFDTKGNQIGSQSAKGLPSFFNCEWDKVFNIEEL